MKEEAVLKSKDLEELEEFINQAEDPRELKRALAVRMTIEGMKGTEIQKILGVSAGFVSKWKIEFALKGVEGLRLRYKGYEGHLSPEARAEIVEWLKGKDYWSLEELKSHIEEKYNVRFKSNQSYYSFFHVAGISWKKTQKVNPKKDPERVEQRKKEIEQIIEDNREDIEAGKLIVYMIDECHLLWGDTLGYVWGKTSKRIEIPLINERERYTYYGALNYKTGEFVVQGYEKEWPVTCELFAPYAPEQNPVGDVWLQAKNFLRECWHMCKNFEIVKYIFVFFTNFERFTFDKAQKYGRFIEEPQGQAA